MTARRVLLLGGVLLLMLLVAAIAAVPDRVLPGPRTLFEVATQAEEPEPLPFEDGTGPGSVQTAETMPALPWQTRVFVHLARVTYRSTGTAGEETVVSGVVLVPRGKPPEGGWPVLALAHATVGIKEPCAPSLSPTLLGSAPIATAYAKAGYAVAMPDYQGLGAPGVHPYLDAPVAGRNLIDAVRALRATYPDVSTRWLALGGSQGGAASWSANEQAAGYAPELDLVGSVSLSPAADVSGLAVKAATGTLTADQAPALQWYLAAQGALHPDLDLDQYRSGSVARDWDVLLECAPEHAAARAAAMARIGPRDLVPRTVEARDLLAAQLAATALPQGPATAPMLVIYGTDDTYVDAAWTTAAVERARALGDDIDADLQPGRGHDDVDGAAMLPWIVDRFEG